MFATDNSNTSATTGTSPRALPYQRRLDMQLLIGLGGDPDRVLASGHER